MSVVALIGTVVLTVLAYIHIIPEKKRDNLNKLGQFLHDVFTFKFLIIEKILRFFYVLSTIGCVCFGVCMLFGFTSYHGYYYSHTQWYGMYGIAIAIVGPISLRLFYECCMMGLLLVKNVIQINNKLRYPDDYNKKQAKETPAAPAAHTEPAAYAEYAPKTFCTECGAKLVEGAAFCTECGTKR
jgi:ribosomal protein L40E